MGGTRTSFGLATTVTACLVLSGTTPAPGQTPARPVRTKAEDDRTFRPTVIVRKGTGQGSGTVIASVPGETLVLTASHVAKAAAEGPLAVEVHRYNLGVENDLPAKGWPLVLPAELAAADPAADVAVIRIRGRLDLPFVARLAPEGREPKAGVEVTSVGVDGGNHFSSWVTRVREPVWLTFEVGKSSAEAAGETTIGSPRFHGEVHAAKPTGLDAGGKERPVLLTEKAPVQGRSGGGLYVKGGLLVGVCVGRIETGRASGGGIFASIESIRKLLRENDLDAVVARSEALRVRPKAKR